MVAAAAIVCALTAAPVAQSNDPSALPRLSFSDVQYVGGFRLPATMSNGDSFSFGGRQLAFNPNRNSLFVGSRGGRVAEVSIPGAVNTTNPDAMPFASYLQAFADPTEGRLSQIGTDGVAIDSFMVYGNRLYGTAFIYYDANNTQRASHYSRSLTLTEPSFTGWASVWQSDKTGFVSGAMTPVPSEWQSVLGGPAVTGQCCIPIVTRTSWGPSAFSFDPARVGQAGTIDASPLLYYTGEHPTLGKWDDNNPVYGATVAMGGMVLVPGTRTALYFGSIGVGPNCYGNGTADPAKANTIGPDGEKYCYDPTSTDKGSHAYPYRYQIWAYDLNDFAAVKIGAKQPWEVVPYGVWPFDLPTTATTVKLGGVGYDAATKTLYLSQLYADQDGYSYRPVIHMLHLNAPSGVVPPVSSVSLTADLPSPQKAGTTVTFSAAPNGGSHPLNYKWMTFDGTAWSVKQDWSTNDRLTYTLPTANPAFHARVWVRGSTSTEDAPEAEAVLDYPINSTRATGVTITTDKTSPQAPGTTVVWTARATGSSTPHYKFQLFDGATWSTVRDWSASNTYTWTPAVAGANYRVSVWARDAASTEVYEATNEGYFAIAATASTTTPIATTPTPTPAPTAPVSRVTAVGLRTDLVAPQSTGTKVTWTATAVGGSSPQYKWQLFDGAAWTTVRDWAAASTFEWTPAVAGANYRMSVWARSGGSTEYYEAATEGYFAITGAPAPVGRVTSVALSSNLPSPQAPNTAITWTATATGGGAAEYKWVFFDGATWSTVREWSTQNTFVWTPTAAHANYRMSVWARGAGSAEYYEATNEAYFAITAPQQSTRVTSVSLTANRVSPQPINTTITWTAIPTGGIAPHQYQFWLFNGTTWTALPWQSSNTLSWTPTTPHQHYRVSVWVKSAGNPAGIYEASTEVYFPIQ
jgi:hypothetical protein